MGGVESDKGNERSGKAKMFDFNPAESDNGEKSEIQDSLQFATKASASSHNSYNPRHRRHTRERYRSRLDIACAILKTATAGARKSTIASHAYVSYRHITDYMNFLLDSYLLYYNSESRKYHTTEKGLVLLEMYEGCKMIFNPK